MLSVYAECHNAECHYAECHYAECHYAECCNAECRGAKYCNKFVSSFTNADIRPILKRHFRQFFKKKLNFNCQSLN